MKYFDKYNNLKNKIEKKSSELWLCNNYKINRIETNSWFKIKEKESKIKNKNIKSNIEFKFSKKIHKCKKINLILTKKQRIILLHWMDLHIKMYNETLKFFKQRKLNKLKILTNEKKIRTHHLKEVRNKIINNSQLKNCKFKTKINTHVLDQSIKDACAAYKSCLSNIKNRNIKYFRLRYLKFTKPLKVITIEKMLLSKNKKTFCSSVFNEEFKFKSNFKLADIDSDFKIHYNCLTKQFNLLVPVKIIPTSKYKNNNTVSLDPGIRTFLTGFSNNKTFTIAKNLKKKLYLYLNKIDDMAKKSKDRTKYLQKIRNLVDDLHWKSINYLIKNYDNILIGNLSTIHFIFNYQLYVDN